MEIFALKKKNALLLEMYLAIIIHITIDYWTMA